MKDTYNYIAIFDYADDGISIEFPDLPGCLSFAEMTEEAIKNAKEAMGLHLWGMEKDGDNIPEPSSLENVKLKPNQIPYLVEVFMPPMRARIEGSSVKKTLTVPAWLNAEAERNNVNFSSILQEGLKKHLGLEQGLQKLENN